MLTLLIESTVSHILSNHLDSIDTKIKDIDYIKKVESVLFNEIEREKLKIARENQANDLAVAKENAKGRNAKKPK